MKLGSNAQSATSYILINFEPYEAIRARDIEPSSYKLQKFIKNEINFYWGNRFIFGIQTNIDPLNVKNLQNAFVSHRSDFIKVKVWNVTYLISEPKHSVVSQLAPNVEYIAIDTVANF